MQESQSLLGFLTLALGEGIITIFMPCIYPIMPMTVSFFLKQQNGRVKALFYGASIILIFTVIGVLAHFVDLNTVSTHWLTNLIFFIVFIIFGLILLGIFELVLPHDFVNKVDALSEKGGYLGVFFMALTLVLVSFSCTFPFVGSLLILAKQGEVLKPIYGMFVYGLPIGLVFMGLAFFPNILKKLPKSGGWMDEMKAVFGFAEFALALKFLSNIDLAYHFNYISRNTFLVIWIIIFAAIGLYILGIIRLPKDSKVIKYNVPRVVFGTLFLAFAAYMIPGVSHNKELSLLSGLLPPKTIATTVAVGSKLRDLPHELKGFYDYDDALAYSKEVGKPLFIDFTGYACANCRKMEENVWPKPEALEKLKNDFVIASLYVDDKKELPKEKQYTSKYDDELKVTVGDKNMDLEITKYNNNAQPYYIIEDSNGQLIVKQPIGYTSKEDFIKFLDEGIGNYKKP
jgi:thiol:disulfide interchange protein DsbD